MGVYFTRREERHKLERPYAFKFQPADGFPTTNVCDDFFEINAEDIRGREQDFTLEKQGFCVHQIENPLSYEDHFIPERLQTYFRQMETTLKHKLQASKVQVFRHTVRLTAVGNLRFYHVNEIKQRFGSAIQNGRSQLERPWHSTNQRPMFTSVGHRIHTPRFLCIESSSF